MRKPPTARAAISKTAIPASSGADAFLSAFGLRAPPGGRTGSRSPGTLTPVGSGIHGSIYHSHSFDAWAARIPGWKVVMPSTPLDAYGLMLAAIEDPNPVMYLIPKALMRARGNERIPGEPETAVFEGSG